MRCGVAETATPSGVAILIHAPRCRAGDVEGGPSRWPALVRASASARPGRRLEPTNRSAYCRPACLMRHAWSRPASSSARNFPSASSWTADSQRRDATPTVLAGRTPARPRHALVMPFGYVSQADNDHKSCTQLRAPVKRLNLDRHPEPPTRRQNGEVLAKIDNPATCTNINDHPFGSVYPQPLPGGSGRILQTRSSDPPGSVVLSQGRNFPSRIETGGGADCFVGRRSQGRNFPSRIETLSCTPSPDPYKVAGQELSESD